MIGLGSDKYVISKQNLSYAAVTPILADDSKRRKNLADDTPLRIVGECLNYKSGLRILIWLLEVPFF